METSSFAIDCLLLHLHKRAHTDGHLYALWEEDSGMCPYRCVPNLLLHSIPNLPLTRTHAPVLSVIGAASAIAHALTLFKTLSLSLRSMMARVLRMEIGRQLLARALLLQAFCTSRQGNMPHVIAPTRNSTRDEHAGGCLGAQWLERRLAFVLDQQLQRQDRAATAATPSNCCKASCNTITSTAAAATLEQHLQQQARAQDKEKNRNCHTGKLSAPAGGSDEQWQDLREMIERQRQKSPFS